MTGTTGTLVLAGTPIGDVADAPPRLAAELETADVVAAEDTRRLRRLTQALGIHTTGRVVSYFEGNESARTPELVEALAGGARLLDFSLRHPWTAEPIPAPGDRATVPLHYWESGHFKAALGDRMIRRIAGDANGFGVEATRQAPP